MVAQPHQMFITDEAMRRDMVISAVTDVPCAAQPVMNDGESAR